MTAPGMFPMDSPVVGQVDRALNPQPMSDEDASKLLVQYENWKRADDARRFTSRPGVLEGIGRGALQGLTFGFGDEIVARLRSLGPETYSRAVEGERDALDMFRSDHPVLAIGSEIAGGLAIPVGGVLATAARGGKAAFGALEVVNGARTVARASLLARLGRGAAQGAFYGGLYGAGTSEGGIGERLEGAVNAVPTGAILGAAIPAAGAALRKTGITQLVGSWLPGGPARQARQFVLRALDESGLTPQQLRDRMTQSGVPNEMVVDAMGPAGQRLAGGAATFATENANKLAGFAESRMAGQGEEILSSFRSHARLPAEDVTKTIEQLVGERAQRAAPLYDMVNTYGVLDDPRLKDAGLQALMQRPSFRRAYEQAAKLAAEVGNTFPKPEEVNELTLEAADWIKKGMDDVLYSTKSPTAQAITGFSSVQRAALQKTRSEFLRMVDETVARHEGVSVTDGTYARAREAFAGPTRLVNALEDGQALWGRKDLDQAINEFGSLTRSEQEMYRRGAIDGLRSKLEEIGDSRDKLKGFFDSPADRRRMRVGLGDAAAVNAFRSEMEQQVAKVETRNLLRNSLTAERGQIQSEIGGVAPGLIAQALSRPLATVGRAVSAGGSAVARGRGRADEILRFLSAGSGGRAEALGVLDELIQSQQQRMALGKKLMSVPGRVAGQAAANAMGAPVGARQELR